MGHAASTAVGQNVQCRFEGGKNCKYEDYRKQRENENAIRGLNSSWITRQILAMQRPSTRLIREFGLLEEFEKNGISAVINVQVKGEHKNCGDGIHSKTGFSYYPEDFHKHNIQTYLFGWQDMGTPPLHLLLDVVQVMDSIFQSEGRVAVHCHAGLGRTGLVIACSLVFSLKYHPHDAIEMVRAKRRGSLQTSGQVKAVFRFAELLMGLRVQYLSGNDLLTKKFSIDNAVLRQRLLLHGVQRCAFRFSPSVLVHCVHRMLQLSATMSSVIFAAKEILRAGSFMYNTSDNDTEDRIQHGKNHINLEDWSVILEETSLYVVSRYFFEYLHQLDPPCLVWDDFLDGFDKGLLRCSRPAICALATVSLLLHSLHLPEGSLKLCFSSRLGVALFQLPMKLPPELYLEMAKGDSFPSNEPLLSQISDFMLNTDISLVDIAKNTQRKTMMKDFPADSSVVYDNRELEMKERRFWSSIDNLGVPGAVDARWLPVPQEMLEETEKEMNAQVEADLAKGIVNNSDGSTFSPIILPANTQFFQTKDSFSFDDPKSINNNDNNNSSSNSSMIDSSNLVSRTTTAAHNNNNNNMITSIKEHPNDNDHNNILSEVSTSNKRKLVPLPPRISPPQQ